MTSSQPSSASSFGPAVSLEALMRHRAWVRGLARTLVRDEATVDDVEQETWVASLRNPPREAATVRAWLGRVVRNLVVDRFRADRRRAAHESAAAVRDAVDQAGSDHDVRRGGGESSVLAVVAQADAHRLVVQAVMELDEPYRATVLLRFFEDLPPREVAARTDVPVETVRTRTRRAVERLRASLDEEHGGDRKKWTLLLLPLTSRPPGAAVVATGTGTTLGAVLMATTMKKALVAATAALLIGGGVWWGTSPGDDGAADAGTETSALSDAAGPGRRSRTPDDAASGSVSGDLSRSPDAAAGAGNITVTVRSVSGEPVGGADVRLFNDESQDTRAWTPYSMGEFVRSPPVPDVTGRTDAIGRVVFSGLAEGAWSAQASAPGFGAASGLSRVLAPGSADVTLDVVLGPSYSLSGRVIDHDGKTLPGALVAAEPDFQARCMVDDSGHYRLDGLVAGDVQLWVGRPGEDPVPVDHVSIPGVTHLDLRLGGGTLWGVVLDAETAQPVPGAQVRAYAGSRTGFACRTTADGAGRYALRTSIDGDVYTITVEASGYESVPVPRANEGLVTLTAGSRLEHDLRVTRGGRVTGVVRGPAGPVAAAMLTLTWHTDHGQTQATAFTDAVGTYAVDGAPAGVAVVKCDADGFHQPGFPVGWEIPSATDVPDWTVTVTPGETARFDVDLAAGVPVAGRVVDDSGRAVVGALVDAVGAGGPVSSGPDGGFVLPGVRPGGEVELVAWRDGVGTGRASVDVGRQGPSDGIVVKLAPALEVTGIVRTAEGLVPASAFVQPGPALPRGTDAEHAAQLWSNAPRSPVGPGGRFEMELPAMNDPFLIRAFAPGVGSGFSATVTPEPGRSHYEVDVEIPTAASVRGKVTWAAGGPAASALIRMIRRSPRTSEDAVLGGTIMAVTAIDGSFTVDGLAPGAYEIVAEIGADARVRRTVQAPDSSVSLVLPKSTAIAGIVTFADGRSAPGVQVRAGRIQTGPSQPGPIPSGPVAAAPASLRSVVAGDDGAFRFERLDPGSYTVSVSATLAGGANVLQTSVSPVVTGTTDLRIVVEGGFTVSGRVEDAGGRPVAGAWVFVKDGGGGHLGFAQTNGDGRFTCTGIPDAVVTVEAQAQDVRGGLMRAKVEGVVPRSSGLVLVVTSGPAMDGVVVDEKGRPLRGGSVVALARNSSGVSIESAYLDNRGRFRLTALGKTPYTLLLVEGGTVRLDRDWVLAEGVRLRGGESVRPPAEGLRLVRGPRAAPESDERALAGQIRGSDGSRIAEALVMVEPLAGGPQKTTRSQGDGTFRVEGLNPATAYRIRAWAPGWVWGVVEDVRPGDSAVTVTLAAGLTSTGRLLDADGEPAADTEIGFRHQESGAPAVTTTDSDGRFQVSGLLDGAYRVRIRELAEDGQTTFLECGAIEAGAADVELRVE